MRVVCRLSWCFASLALVMLLLYISFTIPAFSLNFYAREYNKLSIAESIGMETKDLMIVTSHMIDYIRDINDDLNIYTEVGGVKQNFFNERDIDHMVDVKELFQTGKLVKNLSLIVLSAFVVVVIIKKDAALVPFAKSCIVSVIAIILLITALGIALLLDFNAAFNTFHEIFFNNDLWKLDPNVSLLINIVPLQFFKDIFKEIAVMFISFLIAVAAFSATYLVINNKKTGIKRKP